MHWKILNRRQADIQLIKRTYKYFFLLQIGLSTLSSPIETLELKRVRIKDVWDTPYIYLYPAQYGTEPYDLYSCGKNRKNDFGEQDDITFWKEPNLSYYSEKEKGTIDPVSQFKGYLLGRVIN